MDFETIYREYAPKVQRLCLGYVNDAEQAKDLAQETFMAVWQHMGQFRQEADVGTWVFRIAINKCLRQLEVDKRSAKIPLPASVHVEVNAQDQLEEKHLFLRKCIQELPEMERLLIGLYLEGVTQEKIAAILGISHANVRVKIHRLKELLIKKFNAHGAF